MNAIDSMRLFSQFINILIFIYFSVTLIKLNILDSLGLFISAFGIFTSLTTDIFASLKEKLKGGKNGKKNIEKNNKEFDGSEICEIKFS